MAIICALTIHFDQSCQPDFFLIINLFLEISSLIINISQFIHQIASVSTFYQFCYYNIFYSCDFHMKPLNQIKLITKLFINGKFINPIIPKTFDTFNPANEQKITAVHQASVQDVDLAVNAARFAFDKGPWRRMTPRARANCIYKLAELIQKNADQLAQIESWNNGKPYFVSRNVQLPFIVDAYKYYAGWVDKIHGATLPLENPFSAYTIKQPIGVVGAIIPWNVPLIMQSWKLAPALAAGCTIVLKSAEQTPLSALRVAQLIQQCGFPDGVVNILSGQGNIGQYLSKHQKVDKVAFTGSTQVGYSILRNSHQKNMKRISLQLGGKSAHIVTANADLGKAVQAATGMYYNSGQVCIAGTRLYVHQKIYDQFLTKIVSAVKKIHTGDPFEQGCAMGPLISKIQFQRVISYIQSGKKEGAKLILGGKRLGTLGYFIEPTIFADVSDNMKIAREEIFGPVMSILKFSNNEEVLERANNTKYGLGAGVVSQSVQEVQYFSRNLKAGTIWVNCSNAFSVIAPFGGYKDSGLERQMGYQGVQAYLETKSVVTKYH